MAFGCTSSIGRLTAAILTLSLLGSGCSMFAGAEDGAAEAVIDAPPDSLPFADPTVGAPLRLALSRTDVWDPAAIALGDQVQVILADLLFDGLTEASPEGELRPALATSWTATDGFKRWTFELEAGVSPQTVVASFARLREVAPASAAVALLGDVEAIDPAGESAVVFALRNPNAGFAWLLSGVQYSVYGDEPTGPYDIESQDVAGMTLMSEEFRSVEIVWAADPAAAYEQLTLSAVDAAVVAAAVTRDAASRFGQQPTARSIVRFYGLNLASPNLYDPRVRQAVLSAVDRPAAMNALTPSGFTADGVASAATAGFRYGACNGACVYNPAGARELLAQVGVTPTLVVGYAGADQAPAAAEIGGSLERAGFGVVVQEVPADQLAAMIDSGAVDVFSFGWPAPAGSMDAVIPPLLASYSGLNVTRLVSPEVDALIAEALLTEDDLARWDLLAAAESAALAQWTVIPIAVAHNGLVQRPGSFDIAVRGDGSIDVSSLE